MYIDFITWGIWLSGLIILIVWMRVPYIEFKRIYKKHKVNSENSDSSTKPELFLNTAAYLIVFFILAGTFYVGSIFYKRVGSSDDFFLAGRQLPPVILAAVIVAKNVNLYSFTD